MSEWKPIETAPKDGTEILLLEYLSEDDYGSVDRGCWGFVETSDYNGEKIYDWLSNYGHIEEPTHWMPLPEPPKD